jgi:hypothetical protein
MRNRSIQENLRLISGFSPDSVTVIDGYAADGSSLYGYSPTDIPVIDYSDPAGPTEKTVTLYL